MKPKKLKFKYDWPKCWTPIETDMGPVSYGKSICWTMSMFAPVKIPDTNYNINLFFTHRLPLSRKKFE